MLAVPAPGLSPGPQPLRKLVTQLQLLLTQWVAISTLGLRPVAMRAYAIPNMIVAVALCRGGMRLSPIERSAQPEFPLYPEGLAPRQRRTDEALEAAPWCRWSRYVSSLICLAHGVDDSPLVPSRMRSPPSSTSPFPSPPWIS